MSIVRDALNQYMATAEKVFPNDRKQTLGASEVGQCARKVWYFKNEGDGHYGIERDVEYMDVWGARVRGTIFEDYFWVPAMQARFGKHLLFAGKKQQTFINGFLSATPDGMLIDLTEAMQGTIGVTATCVMVECKTVDPRTNLIEAKDENVYQTHVQMGLVRELTPYKPTYSIISYTDASWWNEVKEFVVAFDPATYDTAKDRALQVMTANAADELKPEGWIAGGHECRYCAFAKACGIERRNLPFGDEAEIDPQFAAEMRNLALEARQHEAERDAAEKALRLAQEKIKTRLREKRVRRIPGVVAWSSVKGRAGYDNKAIQAAAKDAGIDIEQFATEGQPGDRLVISVASPGTEKAVA